MSESDLPDRRRRSGSVWGAAFVLVGSVVATMTAWWDDERTPAPAHPTSAAAAAPRATAPAAPSAPTPGTADPADASVMPVGDLPGWRQIFAEDFDTPVPRGGDLASSRYARGWSGYSGFVDTSGNGWYDPERVVSVQGGVMDWYVHTADGRHRVAAMVPRVPATGWGQTYGRYSFRFRSDALPGYKLVGILWPDSDNWGEGEIDFPEVNSLESSQGMYANLYPPGDLAAGRPGEPARFATSIPANDTGWHVATIDWLPGSLTFVLDGATLGTFTQGVPSTSFHLVFQVETNLSGTPPDSSVSGHVQLDWVTMYEPA